MRFVAVINEGIINDPSVVDYGFVAAKTNYTSTSEAGDNYISKVILDSSNTIKRSCVNTDNNYSGIYGKSSTNTKYKYLTLAVKDVPADQGFVVRFYIKTVSGKVFYATYNTEYSGCVTNYSNLASSIG